MITGAAAACVSKSVMAPCDAIKMIQQADCNMTFTQAVQYIYQEKGLAGFWAGNFWNCARYFPSQTLNFMFKDHIKSVLKPSPNSHPALKMSMNIMSGTLAGGLSLAFVYPIDCFCTLRKLPQYDHMTLNDLLSVGFQYPGFGISVFGILAYRGLYFGLYDMTNSMIADDNLFGKF
eukprot:UN33865